MVQSDVCQGPETRAFRDFATGVTALKVPPLPDRWLKPVERLFPLPIPILPILPILPSQPSQAGKQCL